MRKNIKIYQAQIKESYMGAAPIVEVGNYYTDIKKAQEELVRFKRKNPEPHNLKFIIHEESVTTE